MTIEKLIEMLKIYNPDAVESVKKAYDYADFLHKGQMRESGEAYIIHPLSVASILAELHADADTICAGLLHDTLEDTNTTKEEITDLFNKDVATLVDGVTKISKMNFSTKEAQNLANTRKIITSITEDVRIIIIKLADRLHNMRTLQFKTEFKQKENSMETMDIFVPLAYYIGAYRIKSELEDLSLRYLYPEKYAKIESIKKQIENDSSNCLNKMVVRISDILEYGKIPYEMKVRTKNIYGIYKRLEQGYNVYDIHDLLSLKIMVNNISNCYQTLGLIHSQYNPYNAKFKDYIYNPKTNMYRSIHTTLFGEEGRLVQTQIRTFDMDKIASFGLTAYWDINKGEARNIMQEDLKNKYQFFKSLSDINKMFGDNKEFVRQVKSELFADKVYVYTRKGDVIELPKGSTIIDLAYKLHPEVANQMVSAIVNDKSVGLDYVLNNKDRVIIITDDLAFGPKEDWLDKTQTTSAKMKIKEFINH